MLLILFFAAIAHASSISFSVKAQQKQAQLDVYYTTETSRIHYGLIRVIAGRTVEINSPATIYDVSFTTNAPILLENLILDKNRIQHRIQGKVFQGFAQKKDWQSLDLISKGDLKWAGEYSISINRPSTTDCLTVSKNLTCISLSGAIGETRLKDQEYIDIAVNYINGKKDKVVNWAPMTTSDQLFAFNEKAGIESITVSFLNDELYFIDEKEIDRNVHLNPTLYRHGRAFNNIVIQGPVVERFAKEGDKARLLVVKHGDFAWKGDYIIQMPTISNACTPTTGKGACLYLSSQTKSLVNITYTFGHKTYTLDTLYPVDNTPNPLRINVENLDSITLNDVFGQTLEVSSRVLVNGNVIQGSECNLMRSPRFEFSFEQ